jgi:hypothetical protein
MRTLVFIVAVLGICISSTFFAGCIERHFKQTDTILTKLSSTENVQWTTVIGNKDYSTSESLAPSNRFIQTSDHGFFIAGFFFTSSGGGGIRILKINSNGNLVWEKRVPDQSGEILTTIQRNSGGYSVFTRDGRVFNFDPSGAMERMVDISEKINQSPGRGQPQVTLNSIIQASDGNLIITGKNYANIWQPGIIAGLSQNGTLLWEKIFDEQKMGGLVSLVQTNDGGFLLGKSKYSDEPGGGKIIVIEKTDPDTSIVWNSTLGICNYTFCNNDLLGMHESENMGYEIFYQSHEQSNSSYGNMPMVIVYARLDTDGKVVQQNLPKNNSELPPWLFYQSGPELVSLMNESTLNTIIPGSSQGTPLFRPDCLLKTDDGGFALLGTRYS